ncbi:MAG: Glucose-1-phosphate adenylyltransferase [candidate division BRC1 bacterium ADurb.BinA292]|nr:MAG: Glucose-1-phosphate adenylyltransferase [candidate division BRC1 bacterium ADurb.BinA292]
MARLGGRDKVLSGRDRNQLSADGIKTDMQRVASIVLAGGRGPDFGPLSERRTKAAFPIAGTYRIIDFVLSNLCLSGIRQVGIITQYLPAPLMSHIGSGRSWDFDMADRSLKFMTPFLGYSETRWFNGSADAIAKNINLFDLNEIDHLLILSGEHVYQMDYRELLEFHVRQQADVTLACVDLPPSRQNPRFGHLVVNGEGRVVSFVEKPERSVGSLVSMGVFCFRRDVLLHLLEAGRPDEGEEFTLAGDVLQPFVKHLRAVAWTFRRPWHYLGNLQEYHEFHMRLARGEIELFERDWEVMTNFSDRTLSSRSPAFFAAGSRARDSIISPGAVIEGVVESSVLSPGVFVGRGAVVRDSIILHDVRIEEGARLERVIADKDATFAGGARVGVPDVGAGGHPLTIIPKGHRVEPGETIPAGTRFDEVLLP